VAVLEQVTVEPGETKVGELLGGQGADRQPLAWRVGAGVDDAFHEPQQARVLEAAGQPVFQYPVSDARKVGADVDLGPPGPAAGMLPGALHSGERALADAAGIGIVDQGAIEHRPDVGHQGMVQDALRGSRSAPQRSPRRRGSVW
jgi:hypothetical protein